MQAKEDARREKIRHFIEENLVVTGEEAHFTDSDDIFKMGIVNSLFAMRILNYVEKEFALEVDGDDMEMENFCSVDNVLRFIDSKQD